MAEHAEFSSAELDHLEDALEGLEFAPAREGAPHVRHRLDEYRNILALSRAAMPMVEVPRGLLDDVLAQARVAAEAPTLTPVAALPPPRPGFWSRMRRFGLLPGVALAGTAAIVMLMVERKPEELAAARSEPTAASAPAPESRARADAKAEAPSPFAAQTAAPADAVAAEPAAALPAAAPPAAPGRSGSLEFEETPAAPAEIGDGNAKGIGTEKDAPAVEEAEQSERKFADAEMARWDTIARGDRHRHRGDCGAARNEYALALDDVDARVRARAHAGLGLCDAAGGDRTSADAAYKAARDLDGEIASFIQDERSRGAGTSRAKSKPKAASKAKAEPPPQQQVDQLDPFGK
ncbi:MAG: hypothetical protein JNK45_28430 [Myxococcales bacterium]|nr:hypothetical protein [Myxococcales bacterium]